MVILVNDINSCESTYLLIQQVCGVCCVSEHLGIGHLRERGWFTGYPKEMGKLLWENSPHKAAP